MNPIFFIIVLLVGVIAIFAISKKSGKKQISKNPAKRKPHLTKEPNTDTLTDDIPFDFGNK